MKKTQTRSASKATAKPKLGLRKVTLRDLNSKKTAEPKGGSYGTVQRCR
jgi:uncharacterized protein